MSLEPAIELEVSRRIPYSSHLTSLNVLQKKQSAYQYGNGNPKMNIGKHVFHPASGWFTLIVLSRIFNPSKNAKNSGEIVTTSGA